MTEAEQAPTIVKVQRVVLRNVAGYASITWESLQPDLNLLLGRNGAGKSTVLEALALGLNFMAGRRTEGVLTTTHPDASIELQLTDANEPWRASFASIEKHQGPRPQSQHFAVFYWVETRQPKSRMGEVRNRLDQHPLNRYRNALSELKLLLKSGGDDRALALRVLELCKRFPIVGSEDDWSWIERAILARTPNQARPTSSGQFDIMALVLDLVRLEQAVASGRLTPFVLLDNPETFLHPACQEPLLDLVQEMLPHAQLFIASHSLKLLCRRSPKSVFWLNRHRQDRSGSVNIESVRILENGAKAVFFDLYGDDVSSAVLSLLRDLESPDYHKFLCECALPPLAVTRANPAGDKQMKALESHVSPRGGPWRILDFGAGQGDLLAALLAYGSTDESTTYIALDSNPTERLQHRIKDAQRVRRISRESKSVRTLADSPGDFDVIILCNVAHEILLPELPFLLTQLITGQLANERQGTLVIHEAEDLSVGESRFVMWTSEDLSFIFDGLDGITTTSKRNEFPTGVSLQTFIVTRDPTHAPGPEVGHVLVSRFWSRLSKKKSMYLDQIERLTRREAGTRGLQEALRQRRVAALISQIATICLLERASRAPVKGEDPPRPTAS